MYLADNELRTRLSELDIEARYADQQFDALVQVQPCSIDLRLDTEFWIPRRTPGWLRWPWKSTVVDLRSTRLNEAAPFRHWRHRQLAPGDTLKLKRGEVILGRVYEAFKIPVDLARKVEGRSSFARLGLMIHCTADFINPGWRGHMPLELVNFGHDELRVFPFLPICQLMLVPLSSEPERKYGDTKLASKYVPDDGGPSYWWRDQLVSQLMNQLGEHDLSIALQERLLEEIGADLPYEVLARLERDVRKMPVGAIDNPPAIAERFARSEDRRRRIAFLVRNFFRALPAALLLTAISLVFVKPYGSGQYAEWAIAGVSIIPGVAAWLGDTGSFYGAAALEARRRAKVPVTSS